MQQTLDLCHSEVSGEIDGHLRARRWRDAADALQAVPCPSAQGEFRLRLARNLCEIAVHRPEIYGVLIEALPVVGDEFAIVRGRFNRWTVAGKSGWDGQPQHLSQRRDPISSTLQALAELKPAWKGGKPLAVCGLGDGYLLEALADFSPVLALGREQAVYLIEPRPALLLTLLMLHDFSGPSGPIRQKRFFWSVGPNWRETFRQFFLGNPFVYFPEAQVSQGSDATEIEAGLRKTLAELVEIDQDLARRVEAVYANVPAAQLAELFGSSPPRRPRVLLVTGRFTTVLQYSTADATEAFGKLGWETRMLIEPEPYHAMRKSAMRTALVEFQPDLVFILDHLRKEYDGVFPRNLPFACWIQDHLADLCTPEAGASVTKRDFALTGIGTHFVQRHGYPARQIVDLPNLARIPKRPVSWKSDGLDLVYISNWSRTTDQLIDEIRARTSGSSELRTIADACVSAMIGVYDWGNCLATQRDVRLLVDQAQKECGQTITDANLSDDLVNLMWDRLNNHLYRHQALRWIAELAERKNLSFGLYGRGWETHPELSRFARGVVTPGEDFENLVRRSRINLQLEPFACFTHPRLLSGLFAGGFFLIRDHPFNHLPQRMLDFICANLPEEIETTEQARAAIAADRRGALEAILQECSAMSEQADPVEMARNWQRGGLLRPNQSAVVHLTEIIFSDPAGLERSVARFAADEELRRRVAGNLRQDLESRLSYESGLSRVVRRMEQLLRTES